MAMHLVLLHFVRKVRHQMLRQLHRLDTSLAIIAEMRKQIIARG